MTTSSVVMCPHGGVASFVTTNIRVKAMGAPVVSLTDQTTVSGCPFVNPAGVPQPCLTIKWATGAMRVKVNGQFPLLNTSVGLCLGNIPAPPTVSINQPRVSGQ